MKRVDITIDDDHIDLESVLTDGRLTVSVPEGALRIRVRELDRWCRENGRDPGSLMEAEILKFAG